MEQETTLLQKKKQLTFEELCPLWSQFLKMESKLGFFFVDDRFQTEYSNVGKLCSIKHFDRCCVGEAHGWDGSYANAKIRDGQIIKHENYCSQCKRIADLFGIRYDSSNIIRPYAFSVDTLKDMFMNHWNDKHL